MFFIKILIQIRPLATAGTVLNDAFASKSLPMLIELIQLNKVYETDRWVHFNVRLHFFKFPWTEKTFNIMVQSLSKETHH